ncbi:NAD-dependent epimerase/dehydratase family protein [Prochlorococcus marinus]|uniref:NAD-dependent epimerase/dehydratase family protein n=1 Tax=Prochlorococcus marinus TaxID=1219 RepID=UPI00094D6AA2|nr:NAD-dependent epimerase/dehydratase family protein [Prochlorococcus marinus]
MSNFIVVTGAAGFIGFHLCRRLISSGINVVGLDNINDYYDSSLKEKRLEILNKISLKKNTWKFIKTDIANKDSLLKIFEKYVPKTVVNLAAQAGVRYSLENPSAYIHSNIIGFSNLLEVCKISKVENLLYASSSSVYGGNTKVPFSEADSVNHPISLYAATKISNELLAHTYSHLYGIACTGLRFFTVYGPWGRPDMAPMIFTKAILSKESIRIFNNGNMSRSFTYIDDIIEIICKLLKKPATPDDKFDRNLPNPSSSWNPHRIFNLGNENSINLLDFIYCLEDELGIEALKEYEEMQSGDVKNTASDCTSLREWIGPIDYTSLNKGIKEFIKWYKDYYKN